MSATTDLASEPAVLAVRAPRRRTARTFAVVTADPPTLTDSLLNVVARAVHDRSIDVAKLEALLRMQREILADDARVQFHRAMIAAQGEMTPIVRDADNKQTNSRYARLETIDAAIRPVYLRHGFHLTFNSEPIDGPEMRIVCDVTHTPAGHTKRYHLDAAPETAGPKARRTARFSWTVLGFSRLWFAAPAAEKSIKLPPMNAGRSRDHGQRAERQTARHDSRT